LASNRGDLCFAWQIFASCAGGHLVETLSSGAEGGVVKRSDISLIALRRILRATEL